MVKKIGIGKRRIARVEPLNASVDVWELPV